jgi:hypothetical protein
MKTKTNNKRRVFGGYTTSVYRVDDQYVIYPVIAIPEELMEYIPKMVTNLIIPNNHRTIMLQPLEDDEPFDSSAWECEGGELGLIDKFTPRKMIEDANMLLYKEIKDEYVPEDGNWYNVELRSNELEEIINTFIDSMITLK